MAYRFKITSQALRDLKEIGRYSEEAGLTEADEFAQRLLEHAQTLATFPYRHGSWAGQQHTRKVPFDPYLIFYKVHEEERIVEILRFWHGARDQNRLRLKEAPGAVYGAHAMAKQEA